MKNSTKLDNYSLKPNKLNLATPYDGRVALHLIYLALENNPLKLLTKIFAISILLFSCSYKPIIDQNDKYFLVGKKTAEEDIDKCMADGDKYLKEYKTRRAAKEAARKAVIGGVIGGVTGFIFGNNVKSLGVGAAIGTGVGAVLGGLGVAGEGKTKPDQIKQNYVANCLARQGYQVIGWE